VRVADDERSVRALGRDHVDAARERGRALVLEAREERLGRRLRCEAAVADEAQVAHDDAGEAPGLGREPHHLQLAQAKAARSAIPGKSARSVAGREDRRARFDRAARVAKPRSLEAERGAAPMERDAADSSHAASRAEHRAPRRGSRAGSRARPRNPRRASAFRGEARRVPQLAASPMSPAANSARTAFASARCATTIVPRCRIGIPAAAATCSHVLRDRSARARPSADWPEIGDETEIAHRRFARARVALDDGDAKLAAQSRRARARARRCPRPPRRDRKSAWRDDRLGK
jgi:hypothetical protein